MSGAGLSCEATDVLAREMDIALVTLAAAGEQGLTYRLRPMVQGSVRETHTYPLGREFVGALDPLVGLGLVELLDTPDRNYDASNGTSIFGDRCRITALGADKARDVSIDTAQRSEA